MCSAVTAQRDSHGFTSSDVSAAKAGDEAALGTIWRSLQPAILRYMRSLGTEGAEDVASVVWIELARALPTLRDDEPESLRKLLFTIARRRMIDEIRRRSGLRLVAPLDEQPELVAVEEGRLEDALALLRRLPKAQAEVVALRVVAGFSAEEVAEITGQSAGAVRVMAHRALARLREMLIEEMGLEPQVLPSDVTAGSQETMNPLS
jgi:RNA polymerase sigma-70 factor (ECF subfamily)